MRYFLLALIAGVISCSPSAGPAPEPPPYIIEPPGKENCSRACAHMARLASDGGPCEEATPVQLKDGGAISCTDLCVYDHENGVSWNTDCLLQITSCAQIDTCH